jgi:hypothetical protein
MRKIVHQKGANESLPSAEWFDLTPTRVRDDRELDGRGKAGVSSERVREVPSVPGRRVQCDELQLSLETPEDWTVRGALVLFAPRREGVLGATVVSAKNEAAPRAPALDEHAEACRRRLAEEAARFELHEHFEAVLGGCNAVCMCFSWDAPFGRAEQTLVFVDRTIKGARVRTTFTLTAPIDELPQMRETFAALLRSVRFGSASYAPPPRLPPPPPSGR